MDQRPRSPKSKPSGRTSPRSHRARKSLDALARWQDVELTYGSNAIEGNTLTRSETATVLEKGLTIGGKPLRDHLEALDHCDALGFVRSLARDPVPIREADVRAIHQLVLGRSQPGEAGACSTAQRFISGSRTRLPPQAELPALMAELGRGGCETRRSARKRRSGRIGAWPRSTPSPTATDGPPGCS